MLFFLTVDTLGRIDLDGLPQQTRMELLFADFADSLRLIDANGDFKDIVDWPGVILSLSGDVEEIRLCFENSDKGGQIQLEYLPETVTMIDLSYETHGEFEASKLPRLMQSCTLAQNRLTGRIETEDLPQDLIEFHIAANQLTGSVDFSRIPRKVRWFNISNNQLSGQVSLTNLPKTMEILKLNKNSFSGSLRMIDLPNSLEWLTVSENSFKAKALLTGGVPSGIRKLEALACGVERFIDALGKDVEHKKILITEKTHECEEKEKAPVLVASLD